MFFVVGLSDAVIMPSNTAWVSIRRNGFAENVWRQGMGMERRGGKQSAGEARD